MKQPKTTTTSWSAVKSEIAKLGEGELIKLISDLYKLAEENRSFMHARFTVGDDPLAAYKKIIDDCLYPDIYKNKPIQIAKAKKAVSDYSKAIADDMGTAELMTFFVERGHALTIEFGDIDENFYASLLLMYKNAANKVGTLPAHHRDSFRQRLLSIMESSSVIGWGYHDGLRRIYRDTFA